jgi:predicted NUDIX family NTP pyrophosphohydrolase
VRFVRTVCGPVCRSRCAGSTVRVVREWSPYPAANVRTMERRRSAHRRVKPGISAGILLFRRAGALEVLLAHPGGPYWKSQDFGSWSVPKGIAEDGEDDLERVAEREFAEETGFDVAAVAVDPARPPLDLGEVQLKSGKVIRAWAIEGDLDPALAHSNEFEIEWPPRSGRRLRIPEVDRVAWFSVEEARRRAHPAQAAFVERLALALDS